MAADRVAESSIFLSPVLCSLAWLLDHSAIKPDQISKPEFAIGLLADASYVLDTARTNNAGVIEERVTQYCASGNGAESYWHINDLVDKNWRIPFAWPQIKLTTHPLVAPPERVTSSVYGNTSTFEVFAQKLATDEEISGQCRVSYHDANEVPDTLEVHSLEDWSTIPPALKNFDVPGPPPHGERLRVIHISLAGYARVAFTHPSKNSVALEHWPLTGEGTYWLNKIPKATDETRLDLESLPTNERFHSTDAWHDLIRMFSTPANRMPLCEE